MNTVIIQANIEDLDDIAPLFDGYRVFYEQQSDIDQARFFLKERLVVRDTVMFLARCDGQPAGFAHLFPSFTSTGMRRIFILNDLFVSYQFRGRSVASKLLQAAADYATKTGAARLALATATGNRHAQDVYEHCGWMRVEDFFHYNLPLG